MNSFNQFIYNSLLPWLSGSGLRILLIIVVAYIIHKFGGVIIEKTIRKVIVRGRYSSKEAEKKREDTIISILDGTLGVVIFITALIMVLQEFGVAIGPILAAAGIVGVAVGFGGQYLVKDIITGLFIVLENQYRVGDVVCSGSTCGMVENITLRMTTLRDLDGTVHHIPNGSISQVSNMSKGFSRVNLKIGIGYDSDIEKVEKVVNRIGKELAEDSAWKDSITKAPAFVRIDSFGDSAINIQILGETKPIKQWDVAGELRKRLKIAFDMEGIEIPFPQRVVHQAKSK